MKASFLPTRFCAQDDAPISADETEQPLNVVVVYQDPVTRQWATELCARVGRSIGNGISPPRVWSISHLADPVAFDESAQAAAEAEVLVISIRGTGELPLILRAWIEAWTPKRVWGTGALVALIGLPAQADVQGNRAHQYLEVVARRAGLDFAPCDRLLPQTPPSVPTLGSIPAVPRFRMPWLAEASSSHAYGYLHTRLHE